MTDAGLKAHANNIAQYCLGQWGTNISRDDAAQLADTALTLLQSGVIQRYDSMMTAALRLMRHMEQDQ
jgi:hypothetical protein